MIKVKPLARIYALSAVALTILVILIFEIFRWTLGIDPPGSAGVIAIIVATIWPAQSFANTYRRRPTGREAWRLSAVFTLIAIAVNAALSVVLLAILPGMAAVLAQLASPAGLTVLAVLAVIIFVAIRFAFGYFARTQLRALEARE
ncbi:MAG: ABZJ_00895 family protein [Pseudomonadota bacterium]